MTNEILSTSALPALTDSIKQAIGFSIWNLYRVQSESLPNAVFLLETPSESFFIDERGFVLQSMKDEHCNKISKILFDGYVIPSNIQLNSICI